MESWQYLCHSPDDNGRGAIVDWGRLVIAQANGCLAIILVVTRVIVRGVAGICDSWPFTWIMKQLIRVKGDSGRLYIVDCANPDTLCTTYRDLRNVLQKEQGLSSDHELCDANDDVQAPDPLSP